jgi:hypothetical protein
MTEHIVGGRAIETGKQDQAIHEMDGQQRTVDENEGSTILSSKRDSEESTSTKRAKMSQQQNGDAFKGDINGGDKESSDFDHDEDLNEMMQIAEDLLTGFSIKRSAEADQAFQDACREM